MRSKITPLFCDGAAIGRAHFWDRQGRYSTKTFATHGEASAWIAQKGRTASGGQHD